MMIECVEGIVVRSEKTIPHLDMMVIQHATRYRLQRKQGAAAENEEG